MYNYIRRCKIAKEIWDTLKEKYQGNERTKKSLVTQCLSELPDFKQKDSESIEAYYDKFNEIIYKCTRYGVVRTTLEFNITFIPVLKKEWKNFCLMIKTQENFDTYSLSNLYNVLKAHDSEVKEISKENIKMNFGDPIVLISKTTGILS